MSVCLSVMTFDPITLGLEEQKKGVVKEGCKSRRAKRSVGTFIYSLLSSLLSVYIFKKW